jgi:hypothetical protein
MRHLTLCRERLARIQRILSRSAGALTVRDFARSFSVWEWEIEQAAALGFIKIETQLAGQNFNNGSGELFSTPCNKRPTTCIP